MTDHTEPTTTKSLILGARRALAFRSILPLYMCSLLLGLMQSWPILSLTGSTGLNNPFLLELTQGGTKPYTDLFLGISGSGTVAGLWAFGLLPAGGIFALVYNFVSGGIIGGWLMTERGFWASSRRFFWSFVGLQFVLAMVALLIIVFGGSTLLSAPTVIIVVGMTLLQLLNTLGEYARAYVVVTDRRNPFVALGAAVSFAVRHLPRFLLLTIAGVALHAALIGLAWLLALSLPPTPLSFVWHQMVLAAAVAVKVVRLSWATAFAQDTAVHSSRSASAGDVRAMR